MHYHTVILSGLLALCSLSLPVYGIPDYPTSTLVALPQETEGSAASAPDVINLAVKRDELPSLVERMQRGNRPATTARPRSRTARASATSKRSSRASRTTTRSGRASTTRTRSTRTSMATGRATKTSTTSKRSNLTSTSTRRSTRTTMATRTSTGTRVATGTPAPITRPRSYPYEISEPRVCPRTKVCILNEIRDPKSPNKCIKCEEGTMPDADQVECVPASPCAEDEIMNAQGECQKCAAGMGPDSTGKKCTKVYAKKKA